jgi:RHS repeat-associated protein
VPSSVGNLTGKTDRKNQSLTYTYDQLNRLTQKQYPDNSTVNYTYDNDSRLTQVTDPTGTYQFTFDNMGRLSTTTTQYSFLTSRAFSTAYSYDAASNRTGFTDPESGSTAYVYDTLNRLQTLTAPAAISGGSFGFGYDALSRRTSLTRPNAVNTTYGYDNLSRLLSVTHAKSGTTIDGATYTVDNAGNRTAKTDQRTAVATSYGYNNIYQLLSATPSSGTAESYTYDPVGNRLSSAGVPSYSYNSSNELTSSSAATYGFDLNGNAITKNDSTGVTTYAWDFENRLSSVTLPGTGGTVSFAYDPFGRRIKKASSAGTSIFAYDGENLIEEVNASGGVVARYSQGLNIDEPLAMLRSSVTSFYNADGLGSVTSLANATGSLAQTYAFDSFGKQIASSGSLTNPFQYTGREWDSETGLYYYRARYYDPNAGRFISEDSVRSPIRPNHYRYVSNNSPNRIDSSGMTDQPSNLPNPDPGHCHLSYTLTLAHWTTSTRIPNSDWHFVTSTQLLEDAPFSVPAAVVTCVWERTYVSQLWGHTLTVAYWDCWNTTFCGMGRFRGASSHVTFDSSTQDQGSGPVGTERTTTQHYSLGAYDEANDIDCRLNPKARPQP